MVPCLVVGMEEDIMVGGRSHVVANHITTKVGRGGEPVVDWSTLCFLVYVRQDKEDVVKLQEQYLIYIGGETTVFCGTHCQLLLVTPGLKNTILPTDARLLVMKDRFVVVKLHFTVPRVVVVHGSVETVCHPSKALGKTKFTTSSKC